MIITQLFTRPLFESENDPITQFASNAHEEWRRNYDPTGTKPRIKKNSDGTEGDINVSFEKLHPDWKKENLAAGHAAHHAVKHFGRDMEKSAEHVHNEWMKRNPRADYNAAQHVPYEQLPDDEKEKDRVHVRTMMRLMGHNPEQGVAEGKEDTLPKLGTVKANLMNTQKPTVQVQVFKHNTLRGDSYWVNKEVKVHKTMDQAQAHVDRINKQGVAEGSLGTALPWPNVVNKVSGAMKAMGWKGTRKADGTFMFSTRGQETDDQYYIVIIDNAGEGFFTYALGTIEEGDPRIGEQESLPNTEASVSELMNAIRDGFGLSEQGVAEGLSENAQDLHIGDPVIITGNGVEFEGATGEIIDFGRAHRFVVVDLYNHGRHSFHSSDVSFNEYAGSDDEEARAYDAGELGDDPRDDMYEARMSAALRMANAVDKQRAKSDASLARTPSSIPKKEEPKKADSDAKTVSEHRVKRQALMAQMLNSH